LEVNLIDGGHRARGRGIRIFGIGLFEIKSLELIESHQ
jgi:hypothetical protein